MEQELVFAALALQILLFVAGWFLYLQARSDLTARAAQIPVISEVKALEQSIASMIEQLRLESVQTSAQLEARCREARDLLAALDRRLEEIRLAGQRGTARRRSVAPPSTNAVTEVAVVQDAEEAAPENRYQQIYALADQGKATAEISQLTGASEGEVELILGVRSVGTAGAND